MDKEKVFAESLVAVATMAQALHAYGERSKECKELEMKVRVACGAGPWRLYKRWLNCSEGMRGPSFASVVLMAVAIRRVLPKKEADAIIGTAFKRQNSDSGGRLFGHFGSMPFPTGQICALCGNSIEGKIFQSTNGIVGFFCWECHQIEIGLSMGRV